MRYADTGWTLSMLRTCSRVIALVAMVACLSMTAQAADESGQYKIRPLDPNNAADQEEIIRWLDPSGTADRDDIASLPLQSSLMSKTYLKSDHFNGGGSP